MQRHGRRAANPNTARPDAQKKWAQSGRNLLSRPDKDLLADLDKALTAAARVFPVPSSHRDDLPGAVRELSRMLTAERGELSRSYWSAPRFVSAYLRYFLPWNLFRLAWLLPGLDLGLKPGSRILDLGSGPLTLPLALWCARPDLRNMRLDFLCADVAAKPMEHGRNMLRELAGDAPWTVSLLRAPVDRALRVSGDKDPDKGRDGRYDCVMAGNVLNELCGRQRQGGSLADRLESLMGAAASALAPGGRLFLLEPGTRLGGKLIALSRQGALRNGLVPLAPCTHCGPCPMLAAEESDAGAGRKQSGAAYSGWCHFIHPADGAPRALEDLGRQAGLEKDSLALSCLLLERQATATVGDGLSARPVSDTGSDDLDDLEALYQEIMGGEEGSAAAPKKAVAPRAGRTDRKVTGRFPSAADPSPTSFARVLSAPIRLPDRDAPGRYACWEKGLGLLLDALRMPSGAAVSVSPPVREERDPKSGALLLRASTSGTSAK